MKDTTTTASAVKEHPRALAPSNMVLALIASVLGSLIGTELICRSGVTPNTSIIGALLAILLSRIPIKLLNRYRSVHCQNLIQTSISGATFSAGNCLMYPLSIVALLGRTDLLLPVLIGSVFATIVDCTIIFKSFGTSIFPAEGSWPPGIAAAETILSVAEKGRKSVLLIIGSVMGWVGRWIGIPTDLLGCAWISDVGAILALGVGSIIIGVIKNNAVAVTLLGNTFTFASNVFGEGFDYSASVMTNYMPHGIMVGAGLVALLQVMRMLLSKSNGSSAMSQFLGSMGTTRKTLGLGYVVYAAGALVLALFTGLFYDMSPLMMVLWIIYTAFAAIASELIIGISAMHSGWFPGLATTLIFSMIGVVLQFPLMPMAILSGYVCATGPAFSDMAYDLKCGYILRGEGKDPELEAYGRKQQFISELLGILVSAVFVGIMAMRYFSMDLFVPGAKTLVATIQAGSNPDLVKALAIWAVAGAVIQFVGGKHQMGILLATGLLVGATINGITIIVAVAIRLIIQKVKPQFLGDLKILAAGNIAGSALRSFFASTIGLLK